MARLLDAARQVVVAEVVADRRQVVLGALHDGALGQTAVGGAADAVVVRLGILARVHEVRLLDRGEVAAVGDHRLEEEHRALLELADAVAQLRVLSVELDHLADAVHAQQRLLGGVDGGDVVVVPRHVAALVGRDRGLDVGAGQPRDHQVHHVADGRVAASLSM